MLWLACIAYIVVNDLKDPRRAFRLFAFVAGTDVLGARFAIDT